MPAISRSSIIHGVLVVFAAALIGQSARVQIVHGKEWAERARRQQFATGQVHAARGNILDASGNVLVESREMFRLNVAPGEIKDMSAFADAMRNAGFPREWIAAASDRRRKWITLPGLHVQSDAAPLMALSGVHAESVMSRDYVNSTGIRRLLGSVGADGKPVDGIELAMDGVLSGDTVQSSFARDVKGRRLDSPDMLAQTPRPGGNVTLTINRDLQDICESALASATDSLHAAGGDIVVLNPKTGDVLAMASRRAKPSYSNTAVTEPFEPGSTIKPFMAAALLERRRARTDEMIDTYGGEWKANGRTITDSHKAQQLSLADVIRFSSNIGIVQFSERLTPREKYETLRDLGLGTATGVPLPSEADGTLREPAKWNATSSASIAMGYELTVTPLQLVAAYATLANGGEMMEAHIVKEVRGADGELVYEAKPRVLRRVFSEQVSQTVRKLMVSVVDSGTGVKADLATFQLAGKSGTARRATKGRGYLEGNYTASFVGLFPADDPQFVVLVKIDNPRGDYYGGDIAAPVSAVVLRAALAARDAALNRGQLAVVEKRVALPESSNLPAAAADARGRKPRAAPALIDPTVNDVSPAELSSSAAAVVPSISTEVALPYTRPKVVVDEAPRPVPDVAGMTLRDAVHALHTAGFRVRLVPAPELTTIPAAGTPLVPGSIVTLQHIP
jgi:cell division protein FtsI (penicillin-binding protein 3)